MLVKNVQKALKEILKSKVIALDTETTGLFPYSGDRLFSIIISTSKKNYYFNFNKLTPPALKFIKKEWKPLLDDPKRKIYMHNAKFDLHMLHVEGIEVKCQVVCTQAIGRVVRNDLADYKLATLGDLIGVPKDDAVIAYMDKHKLYEKKLYPGKKKVEKYYSFDKVPLKVMHPYGETDGGCTYKLGKYEEKRLRQIYTETPEFLPRINQVYNNEVELTRVLFNMEARGIKIDRPYVEKQLAIEQQKIKHNIDEFEEQTGIDFKDSRKIYRKAFTTLGLDFPLTPKGNPCFNKAALGNVDHPIAKCIVEYRKAYKRANTYYVNYLTLADKKDIIHTDFIQGGATTGRMSCARPNLQNVTKKKEEQDEDLTDKDIGKIRRCFIPRSDFFVMFDWDQMEYRLMLDYAEEMSVIEEVKSGVDVHQAFANVLDTPNKRYEAKQINFMLIYGGGNAKLASMLYKPQLTADQLKEINFEYFYRDKSIGALSSKMRIPISVLKDDIELLEKSKEKRENYFTKLPNVKKFIKEVSQVTKRRGYIFNWLGRRSYIPRNKSYIGPNYLIQGGCADIVKKVMVEVEAILKPYKTQMLLQIHDELLLEGYFNEKPYLLEVKRAMEGAYKHVHLPLTVSVEWSETSWADKEPFKIN